MPGRLIPRARSCLRSPANPANSHCRPYATKVLQDDRLGPLEQDEHQSFRVRESGKKLAIPPILDPLVIEKTLRWEQKKAKPDVSKFTPFQKKLWENPYAHALSSPIRADRSTSTHQPTVNLITLHPSAHPTTADPWLLPISLTTSKAHLGMPYRFLAHKYIASHLSKKKAYEKGLYQRFYERFGSTKLKEKIVWREDMAELVEGLLQNRVVEKLAWHFKWVGRLVAVKSPRPEDIEDVDNVSCVLHMESLKTKADAVQKEAEGIVMEVDKWTSYWTKTFAMQYDPHKKAGVTHQPPPWYEPVVPRLPARARFPPLEFKKTTWRQRQVALYSLTDLLGEEKANELLAGTSYEGERCFVMRRGRHNVPVELLLMQLQAYLAEPGPYFSP